MSKILFLLLLLCVRAFSLTDCQTSLARLLKRASPDSKAFSATVPNLRTVQDLNSQDPGLQKLFKPELKGTIHDGGEFKLSVVTPAEFETLAKQISKNGFWTVFYPSDSNSRIQVGHFGLVVGDSHFTRNVDEAGPGSMVSAINLPAAGLGNNPGIMVQFFETSPQSVEQFKKFMHDRVWMHHQGAWDYNTKYVPLPFTRDAGEPNGENCVSFCYPFYNQRWLQQRPELNAIAEEVGSMRISEIPSRQLFFNTQSPAYRGSLIITPDPQLVREALKDGRFNEHSMGAQLLFDGNLQEN